MKLYLIFLILVSLNVFGAGSTSYTDFNVNGKLTVTSTTKGSTPCPVMTQAQRDAIVSPTNGQCVFNSDSNQQNNFNATAGSWFITGAGDVVGPASSTDSTIPLFNGTTGKLIKGSGVSVDGSNNVSANSFYAPSATSTSSFSGIQINNSQITATGGTNLDLTAASGAINLKKNVAFYGRKNHVTYNDITTGSNATLENHTSSFIRLTGTGLVSVDGIPAGNGADTRTILNLTGADVTFNNDSGATTANRILTGTGADFILKNNASITVAYDLTQQRWFLSGGTGDNGGDPGILKNSYFDSGVTNWTLAAGTTSTDPTDKVGGNKSLVVSLTGQALSIYQDSTMNASSYNGTVQGVGYAYVKPSFSANDLVLCARQAGATTSYCTNPQIVTANQWNLLSMPFKLSATSSGIIIKTTASYTGTVKFSKAWLGAQDVKVNVSGAKLLGTITITGCTSNYTTTNTTYSAMGTNTGCTYVTTGSVLAPATQVAGFRLSSIPSGTISIRARGSFGKYTTSTNTDVSFRIQDMTNSKNGQDNIIGGATSTGIAMSVPEIGGTIPYNSGAGSTSFEIYGKVNSGAGAAIFIPSGPTTTLPTQLFFEVWSSGDSSSYSSNNADIDWADCNYSSLTWTGLGTVTNVNLECKRRGSDLLMRGKFNIGTISGTTEMRLPLPLWNGQQLSIRSMTGVQSVGSWYRYAASDGTISNAVAEGGFTYLGFSKPAASSGGYNPSTRSMDMFASGETAAINGVLTIPIAGWDNSNIIIGQFNGLESCTDSYQCTESFDADISSTGVPDEKLDWINGNCTVASGTYTCPLISGLVGGGTSLSSKLKCTVSVQGSSRIVYEDKTSSTTSQVVFKQTGLTGTAVNDTAFTVRCSKSASDYVPKSARAVASDQNVKSIGSIGVDVQSVYFGGNSSCNTACTTGNCTICNQIGSKITSVSWGAGVSLTGAYALNGIDGTKYNCFGNGYSTSNQPLIHNRSSSTSSYARVETNPAVNTAYNSVTCIGIP